MIEYAKDHAIMKYTIEREKRFSKAPTYHQIINKLGNKDQDVMKKAINPKLDAYYKFCDQLLFSINYLDLRK